MYLPNYHFYLAIAITITILFYSIIQLLDNIIQLQVSVSVFKNQQQCGHNIEAI